MEKDNNIWRRKHRMLCLQVRIGQEALEPRKQCAFDSHFPAAGLTVLQCHNCSDSQAPCLIARFTPCLVIEFFKKLHYLAVHLPHLQLPGRLLVTGPGPSILTDSTFGRPGFGDGSDKASPRQAHPPPGLLCYLSTTRNLVPWTQSSWTDGLVQPCRACRLHSALLSFPSTRVRQHSHQQQNSKIRKDSYLHF